MEKDELSDAGGRFEEASVTLSFKVGAYMRMKSLILEWSLCFGICDRMDWASVLEPKDLQKTGKLGRLYRMLMVAILIQVIKLIVS